MKEEYEGLVSEETRLAIKQAYLKTLQEELAKAVESPETIARINEWAPRLAEWHASSTIEDIKVAYNRRMNEIKRSSARFRLMLLLPLSIAFGLVSFYNFQSGHLLPGVGFIIGSTGLLAAFVLGLIFDRPR